jgi:hypothetical protein
VKSELLILTVMNSASSCLILSKHWMEKRIASSRHGNLIRAELASGGIYAIFFTLRRVNNRRAELFVVSAFQWGKSEKAATTGGMNFNVALAKVLEGKPLKFPHR